MNQHDLIPRLSSVLRVVAVAVVVTLVAAAQRTWTVDRLNRPGADYIDLPAAVAAVGEGDVLFLRYVDTALHNVSYAAPLIDGKSLVIRGDPAQPPEITGKIQIRNLVSSQSVVLQHLHLGTLDSIHVPLNFGDFARGLHCSGNAGRIHLQSIEYGIQGFWPYATRITNSACMRFHQCALVTVTDSTVHLVLGNHENYASNLVLVRSRFLGGVPPEPSFATAQHTIACEFTSLWLIDSVVEGTNGSSQSEPGRSAVDLCSSEVRIAGTSTLRGGVNYFGGRAQELLQRARPGAPNYWQCTLLPPVSAHRVLVDPRATLSSGFRTGALTFLDQRVTATSFTLGSPSPFTATAYTHANALAVIAGSLPSASPTLHVGGLPVHLDLGGLFVLGLGFADANGEFTLSLPVGPVPLPGVVLGVQALELLPDCSLGLSNITAPLFYP